MSDELPVVDLAQRILDELKQRPGQKAASLAQALGADRREVNRCLSYQLAGKVQQDAAYRWSLRGIVEVSRPAAHEALSELGWLARYYLECIGQDSDEGVSVFAANRYGAPDYAELDMPPLSGQVEGWWSAPGVGQLLGKVKADRGNLVAFVGYPVRLRRHRTPKWEGFFVEPVMLWQVEIPEQPGESFRFADELPSPNFAFLRSLAMGDPAALVEEAARLGMDLGLDNPVEDRPEPDELMMRLADIRPDWDWQEPLDVERCSTGPTLSEIAEAGIYNRAVVLVGKRSPYTQGLESELKSLAEKSESDLAGTALGHWLGGKPVCAEEGREPLLEVLPMNSEQRHAIRSALREPLTVVTGPPGTGKSQVVTNLLVNAAWRGHKVLFASKNNKAVDVVEARVNGLGNRPVLLRLGSKEYQAKLSSYLTALLSGEVSRDDQLSYEEGLERHRQLASRLQQLDETQGRTLAARNRVDQLDASAEDLRMQFGEERFNQLDRQLIEGAPDALERYGKALAQADIRKSGWWRRMVAALKRASLHQELWAAAEEIKPLADHLGVTLPHQADEVDFDGHAGAVAELQRRIPAAQQIQSYQDALETLRQSPSFEQIAQQRQELGEQMARNSAGLWRDYVNLTPKRLNQQQRQEVGDYAAALQLITGSDARTIHSSVRNRAKALQQKVTQLFSCWAVTSLSARGKVPFEPGYFDLVVIDEASQCDIASVLPLLYRAKRAVIIGDPMQLRHISSLTRSRDSELQAKHGLVERRMSWMYSVNSLYDLAASVARAEDIVSLRDHHRSHADIIGFSNQAFYNGKLRVATRYSQLKRPNRDVPGVAWLDVKGRVTRPGGSGAANEAEAKALIGALRDLLIHRDYDGTVGVVAPFRGQVDLLQKMIAQDDELTAAGARSELLVDTVHKFQGDERDVIFFSPVVSAGVTGGALGFLRSNGNLFNVAITRARGLLHVVGDRSAALDSGIDYLADFCRYAEEVAHASQGRQQAVESKDLGPKYPTVSNPERVSGWEHRLYEALYAAGVRAVPQFSVEQYDLDFALFAGDRRLNIEVDGERYHRSWTGELCLRDQLRNQRLLELGWEVKRFWVYEIRDRLDECTAWVRQWVEESHKA